MIKRKYDSSRRVDAEQALARKRLQPYLKDGPPPTATQLAALRKAIAAHDQRMQLIEEARVLGGNGAAEKR